MEFLQKWNIYPAYPNPFNPLISLPYEILFDEYVEVDIYNLKGEKISNLFNGFQLAGNHVLHWNADNFSSGIYIARFKLDSYRYSQKLVLIK